jgi:hypothetical protein
MDRGCPGVGGVKIKQEENNVVFLLPDFEFGFVSCYFT